MPDKYKKRTVSVMWMPWSNQKSTLDKFISDFNDSQQDVYAQILYIQDYQTVNDKLAAALQAKKVPDIAGLGSNQWWRFMLDETLEPLDGHFSGNFDASKFYKVFLTEGQVNNKTFWMPWGRSTPMTYYNKDIFHKAGLPDRAPKTFTEFRDWGKQLKGLKAKGQQIKLTAFNAKNPTWLFNNPAWSFGGHFSEGLNVTVDDPGVIAAAKYESDLIHSDGVAYGSQTNGDDFTNGLTAVNFASTAGLTAVLQTAKFDVGTGFEPGDKLQKVPTGGGGLSILRGISDERKQAAAKLLEFLYAPERVAAFSVASGYIPCTMAATNTDTIQKLWKNDPRYKTASDQLKNAQFEDLLWRIMPLTSRDMDKSMQKIYSDASASPADEMKALAEKVKQQESSYKKKYEKVSTSA